MRLQDKASHFDAVKECDSRVVTAVGAVVTVVEDPALSVLKKNPHKAEPSGNFRGPRLKDPAASPGTELLVEDLVSHMEVSVLRGLRRLAEILLSFRRIPQNGEAFFLSHLRCTQNHWSGYWRIMDSMV